MWPKNYAVYRIYFMIYYVLNVSYIIFIACITLMWSRKNELPISQLLTINVYVPTSLFFKYQTVYNNSLDFRDYFMSWVCYLLIYYNGYSDIRIKVWFVFRSFT